MDCREATRKCAEWKHKFKGARIELQQVRMRLNVETDRADRAERDKLRSDAENAFLRQAIEDERGARRKSDDRSARLAARVKELEKINKIHDNAHTPSSRMTYTQKMIAAKKNRDRPKSGRKQGAQKGHPGKTSKPEPTEFEEHTMSECPNCGSDSIINTGQKTHNITETPPPAKPVTTRHTINVYECCRCGQKGMEPDAGLPSAGDLGRNACGRAVINFDDRMPHRTNARRMGRGGPQHKAGRRGHDPGHAARRRAVHHRRQLGQRGIAAVPHKAGRRGRRPVRVRAGPAHTADQQRGLREIVIHRKIRGSLRAEESMEIYGNIFTRLATWKNQGLDYVEELRQYA